MTAELGRRAFLSGAALTPGYLAAGSAEWSAEVETQDPERPRLRFAVASDGHFGEPETDYGRFHRDIIHWLNEETRTRGLDFVVFNGDLVHDDPLLLPKVKEVYDHLQTPYYVVRGNHDKALPGTWESIWGYPENHAVEKGDCALLLACTTNEKGEYLCAAHEWLAEQLKALQQKRWVFVFMHIVQRAITENGVDCPEVTRLLEGTPNVAAVFHGHDHDQDHVVFLNKRAYFFDGHFGGSWGTAYRGYRIVEVGPSGGVRTYQCNPQAYYVNSTSLG